LPGKKKESKPADSPKTSIAAPVEAPKAALVSDTPKASTTSDGTAVYQIEVQTGNVASAGVDAPVDIVITGSNGELPKFALKNATSKNKDLFEKGGLDIFELKEKDIGKVNFFLKSSFSSSWIKIHFICI
jgi:hypothetical protein